MNTTRQNAPVDERAYARAEAETRRRRPPTDTLPRALRVFWTGRSAPLIASFAVGSALARAASGPMRARELTLTAGMWGVWPFLEWAAHKEVLHIEPTEVLGVTINPFFAQAHRRHHANPSYFPDVFLPRRVVLGSFVTFAAVFAAATRDKRWVWTGMASVSAAALLYEWVHYIAHTDYKATSPWLARVVRNHRLHHYRSEHNWYGFSVPHVDEWFGTGGEGRDVAASQTTRDLGINDGGWAAVHG